jgi:myo-inositol-1(or 4)-monophosphatase
MNQIDLEELRTWMRDSGAIARRYFNHVTGRRKADSSWVTEADLAIEQMLGERLVARYPEYGLIGEEQTRRALDHEYLWALDPIDGTASFIAGLPTWGISLGLLRNGAPYFGIIYMPLLDDCYWAGPSGGAFLNDQPIQVIASREWESQDWLSVPSNVHRRFQIDFIGKTRSIGCTAASFCYVARGSAVGALLTRAAIWDIAAGLAILDAAGGSVVGLSGAALDTTILLDGRSLVEPIVIGAPIHAQALRELIHQRGGS